MRGVLVVVFEEALDDAPNGLTREDLWRGAVDASIYIAFQDSRRARGALRRKADRRAYWSVLRLCARLGMIAFPCYVIYNNVLDNAVLETVTERLRQVVDVVDRQQDAVLGSLSDLSIGAAAPLSADQARR